MMTLKTAHGWMMALLSVAAGISLGVTLRAADASASDGERCPAEGESWGRLIEVRRIAGTGSLDSQGYWGDSVILRVGGPALNSFNGMPGDESFFSLELEPESEP